jgi:ABC-type transporter Mla subunit MlaD
MPPLDEFARAQLGRALASLEDAIAGFEARGAELEPNVDRLNRLCDDIRTVLRLARDNDSPG